MTAAAQSYDDFIRAKAAIAPRFGGIEVDEAALNPALAPHTRRMVAWGLRGGRRAWFANFGLHKTATQLEAMRVLVAETGRPALIIAPLGVRREFLREADLRFRGAFALDLRFVRTSAEVRGPGVYLTNYESVREGKIDPSLFGAVSLDEAAILRGFGGTKTFREFMAVLAGDDRRDRSQRVVGDGVQHRFVATATPSPNEYIELLAYAAFLGVMDIGAAKTRFFKRNSEKADNLTLMPHKEAEFWLWVASWALFVTRPSDLDPAFSDAGYDLPPLDVRWHELPADHADAGAERDGQGRMFRDAALGLSEAAREKRDSLPARVARVVELVRDDDGNRKRARSPAPEDGDVQGVSACISARLLPQEEGAKPTGAGEEGVHDELQQEESPQAPDSREAADLWAESVSTRSASGISRAPVSDLPPVPRGAGDAVDRSLTRDGLRTGCALPNLQRGARDARGEHGQPGACDRVPEPAPIEGSAQCIIWCDLNDEQRAIERALIGAGITVSSLYGSQPLEEREQLLENWRDGRTAVFLSKPSMYGAGVNLQQSSRMIFSGVTYKFNDTIQAIHRIQRFGQAADRVAVDLIYTEGEREVRRALERKWRQHEEMVARMVEIIREYGLTEIAMHEALARSMGQERVEIAGEGYRLVNADCVEETRRMAEGSVDLIVTSIPFATQYEYTPSFNDFGHTDDDAHFWAQMRFLIPELLRVLAPGRVAAIHVKDRIVPGGINGFGFQTLSTFHCDTIREFMAAGFAYLGMKTIATDVVRENNQTYRLGWTEQCKDGTRMGCGVPEYLLLFRKPPSDRSNGYADRPVKKAKKEWDAPARAWRNPEGYSRARWQVDAHGFTRSSGDRCLRPGDLDGLAADQVYKVWREHNLGAVYDFEHHVAIGEHLERSGRLPPTFMLLPPHSVHPDIWSDVARMVTLNSRQAGKGREQHLCPLQFDIVDRAIAQFTEPGETVFDPFGGLMTVPFRAVTLGRRGVGVELNPGYFLDGAAYVAAAAQETGTPSLFDFLEGDGAAVAAE